MWKLVGGASTPRYGSGYGEVCTTINSPLQTAGNLSSLFDIGGVLGGVAIGYLADTSGASALVSWGFVLSSVPVLYMYRTYGHISMSINVVLMMLSGFFVNGPYALITTAVSADLVRVWRECCISKTAAHDTPGPQRRVRTTACRGMKRH